MRSTRRPGRATTWTAIGVALLVHGALFVSGTMFGTSMFAGGFAHHDEPPPSADADVDIQPSCLGDAFLASGARYALCWAPWYPDTEACLDDAPTRMAIDLSSCPARAERA